jgi:hypothetical protein
VYFKRRVYVKALHELARFLAPQPLPEYPDWWPEFASVGSSKNRRGSRAR